MPRGNTKSQQEASKAILNVKQPYEKKRPIRRRIVRHKELPGVWHQQVTVPEPLRKSALKFLESIQDWNYPNSSARSNPLYRGKNKCRTFYGGESTKPIPAEITALSQWTINQAKKAGLPIQQDFLKGKAAVVVNQYHKGWGIGQHRDTPRVPGNDMVLAVTIYKDSTTPRTMKFYPMYKKEKGFLKTPNNLYAFWGPGYANTKHTVDKYKGPGIAYSLTIRPERIGGNHLQHPTFEYSSEKMKKIKPIL